MQGRTHGIAGYNLGCRCDVCREAKAIKRKEYQSSKAWEYQKSYRERLKQNNPEQYRKMQDANNKLKKEAFGKDPERYRWQTIYKKYKLTKQMYLDMLEQQGGVCQICQGLPKKYWLAVDHNHDCCPGTKTCGNCIRGLLCSSCNSFLGRVSDNAKPLIEYLNRYSK
jgi:hypothetical protein